jgi:hypothetical protein
MSNAIVQLSPAENIDHDRKLIRTLLAGTLGAEDMKLLGAWAEGLGESIKQSCGGKAQSVCVLVDIHEFERYTDAGVLTILADLMKKDNPYVYRTATFGGNTADEMIEHIIKSMANRQNLKNFKTEEEALKWLAE